MLIDLKAQALAGVYAAGERVLVAVSELASAPELVRAAKRLADALKAPWTALHAETRRAAGLAPAERQRLADTLALATSLGAATATIPAQSVVEGLTAYATDARATQIVIGKSRRSRWFELRHGSVVDHLVREIEGVAIHVLPTPADVSLAGSTPRAARIGTEPDASATQYARAAALVALTTAIGVLLGHALGVQGVDLLYLLPVMAAASRGGLWPGLLAGVLSALAFNFFFLPPIYTFTIANPQNAVTLLVLLAVAFATSQLAARVRAQADLAQTSARQNAALAGFARQLGAIATEAELAQALAGECARLFDAHALFLSPRDGTLAIVAAVPPETRINDVARAAAEWVVDRAQPAGRGSDTLPAADWLFVPVMAGTQARAVLGLSREDGRDPVRADRRATLSALAEQAGLALARIRSEADLGRVARLEERDRLRAALLASVGHDLRTPLTTILGAAREIAGRGHDPVADALHGETLRLQRFVTNLLDMARVEAGALRLNSEPVDLTDAVASAAADARTALAGHAIALDVPPDLPLVRADPQLLHHCLLNLLDNAGKFAAPGTPIGIRAARTPGGIALSVEDEGPGLPPGHESRVWDTFAKFKGSDRERNGSGLGLAIVRGFAEAMGFTVTAANRNDVQGARFTLIAPEDLIVRASTPARAA